MKLHIHAKRLLIAAVFTCLAAFPSFAAETKQECREEAAKIRAEIQEVRDEIQAVRAENIASADRYRSIAACWRESGALPVNEEIWQEAREIHQEIKPIRDARETNPQLYEQGAYKELFQSGDYDAALNLLENRLKDKEDTLKTVKKINAVWKRIDKLLGSADAE